MALLKRNIWTLFYIIVLIGVFAVSFYIYKLSTNEYEKFSKAQESITRISANSISSVLLQYELILDILSEQLIRNENYKSVERTREIFKPLLKINNTIFGFALFKPNGELYITSATPKKGKASHNLLKQKETRDSFLYTLENDKMVIGRTYFNKKVLNSLIIPVRKSIRDKNGKVVAVLGAAVSAKKSMNLLSDTKHRTVVVRTFDHYIQLSNLGSKFKFYDVQIPQEEIKQNDLVVEKKYGVSIEEIKKSEKLISLTFKPIHESEKVIGSLKYLDRYELWVTSQTPISIINNSVLKESWVFILGYLALVVILYLFFKSIVDHERKKQEALVFQANHDYLTKLNNRTYLSTIFLNKKSSKPYSVFFIDLDNFKLINDNYGHIYGDQTLKEVANRLIALKEKNDTLVRISGDEFLLITNRIEKHIIQKLARKIIEKISEPYYFNQYHFILSASIGISQYPQDANSFDTVRRYADIAMYEAKKKKNSFLIFEDSIKHKYLKNSSIEQELKNAISKKELYMVYQPQVDKDGNLFGVEALVRWENEKLGYVPPDEFISIAENIGEMVKLGYYIMETSLREISDIQNSLEENFHLSINISVKQFMEIGFYKNLLSYIEEFNFDKKLVTLEVTENVFIEDLEYILEVLNKLKKKGIKVSLDDFGTGYSSLSLLKKLPIDELKIDKSFMDGILEDEGSENMVRSIISIGKKFNMTLLAEGIENISQKELLDTYNCDLYQGYYYSKPLKKSELLKYIKKKKSIV